jgi:hypothetical protein
MTSFLLQVSEDCRRSWTEGEIKPGCVKGCDDSDLVGRRRRKEQQQKERKKISSCQMLRCQWQGGVCWLMTFQRGDKCMRKREDYGWTTVFEIAWSIVGDAHSDLPRIVMYVEVKAAMFSVCPSEQKNTIHDVTPV